MINTTNTNYLPNITTTSACSSRLPCGLCLITNQPCPFMIQTFQPSCTCAINSSMEDNNG